MKCANCQFDVAASFAFCPACGSKLAATGSAPPVATQADRRSATVLFADLSGFTSIAERLDPEDVRALQTDLFAALRAVMKCILDGKQAAILAPTTVLAQQHYATLTLHIGIDTGRVVAGHLGSAADAAYAVTGDAVNTAARLQSAAGPGQTLVSRTTFLLTQDAFAFESGGTLALKGKAQALAVYRLLAAQDNPVTLRGLAAHGLVAPLIGRDGDLAHLLDVAHLMLGNRPQVVSLIAEAGVGKTRLVDALLERMACTTQFAHTAVSRVACSPLGQRPFGVAAQLFREAYGITSTDTLDEACHKVERGARGHGVEEAEAALVVPVLGFILGLQTNNPSGEIEPERLKRQIVMALRTVLERRFVQGPLVLVMEDLQWADAASIEGLLTLCDWLYERPLLLLLSGRPPFDFGALDFGRPTHSMMRLAPLPDEAKKWYAN